MRPLRIELKGFTSFRDEQAVDFEGLDLFAVSGQTGSGKSSLLDAMTYALFGYVERVGRQVGQLVSQGQQRMAVKMAFRVGNERFRVTRSTSSAKGATKILLERWDGDDWRQAGEGSDRVRDADAMIERIVGLDYDGFTRSVLLPQGRFAEFLVGEAKDRRKILTELLGLDLFVRLAARAGELKRTAGAQADAKASLLETEYVGVTEEAVVEARAAAREARAREKALVAAEKKVLECARRWERAEGEVRELRACAYDARAIGEVARTSATEVSELVEALEEAGTVVRQLAKASEEAAGIAEGAGKARTKAEAKWGRVADLVAIRTRAEGLADLRAGIDDLEAGLREARAGVPKLENALARADKALARRSAARERAGAAVRGAREALERAQHADLVAAVRAGVRVGDSCPVCGAAIASLPKGGRAPDLEKARAAVARTEKASFAAETSVREAEQALHSARASLADARKDAERLEKELAREGEELTKLERAVARAMRSKLPSDPVAVLDERIEGLEELVERERRAADEVTTVEHARVEAERVRAALLGEVGKERARLEAQPLTPLLDRSRALGGRDVSVPHLPSVAAVPEEAAALGEAARALASGLEELAASLEALAVRRGAAESALLAEAEEAVGTLVGPPASLAGLLESVAEERRRAAGASATARREVEGLQERLENSRALAADVRSLRAAAERYGALAGELRADRIIAFLQLEALQALAAAGSEHLATLSGGRYRMRYKEDEFFVVDTWNGEETRSARTLSGGETFLASLALALALSEQVQSLAVTERARLESLFLDEGFGTLDPETLEVVVDAIEQLGGDGRMVGVITHVQELAIRLPARIEVEKSPRGSRLAVVS